MPNFDALRSAIIGPLEYLCKPQKPHELLGLWTLNENVQDLSRYGNTLAITPNYYDSTFFAGTKQAGFGTVSKLVPFPLSKPLDMTLPWSIDWVQYKSSQDENSSFTLAFGNIQCQSKLYYVYQLTDGTTTINSPSNPTPFPYEQKSSTHWAIRYDGTNIKWFTSGILRYTYNLTPTGTASSISATLVSGYSNYSRIQNFRVVQKFVGTETAFPVPATLYTGYEAL